MHVYHSSTRYSKRVNDEIDQLVARARLATTIPAPPDWFEKREKAFTQRHQWKVDEIVTMEAGWYFLEQYDMFSAIPDPTTIPLELSLQWWIQEIQGQMVWAEPHATVELAGAEPRRPIAGRMHRLGRLSENIEPFFNDRELEILRPWHDHAVFKKSGLRSEVIMLRKQLKTALNGRPNRDR